MFCEASVTGWSIKAELHVESDQPVLMQNVFSVVGAESFSLMSP